LQGAAFSVPCRAGCGCDSRQEADASRRLAEAFSNHWDEVQSFRIDDAQIDTAKDAACWHAGEGWWLSTAAGE
jgi:protein-L-isoaspartate(D-aspartate) O-methyltransferase